MPTIRLVSERTAEGRVQAIYDEIKTFFGTSYVPVNFDSPTIGTPGGLVAAV